jgi:hypothetical protein
VADGPPLFIKIQLDAAGIDGCWPAYLPQVFDTVSGKKRSACGGGQDVTINEYQLNLRG